MILFFLLLLAMGRAPVASAAPVVLGGLVTSDENGRPIASATVEIFADTDPDESRASLLAGDPIGPPLARGRTDAGGRFRVEVAGGRRVIVVAGAVGRERRQCGQPFLAAAARELGECPLAEGRTISGRVVRPSGAPAAGALVLARRAVAETERWDAAGRAVRTIGFPAVARTGSDGRFTLEGAARLAVDLHVFAPAAAPMRLAGVRRDAGVEIRLAAGVPVVGLVIGPGGGPVPGAWVMAGADGWDGIARADAKGAFAIARVRPGGTSLVAAAADAEPASDAGVPAPSAAVIVNVEGGDAAPPAPVVLRLRPGGSVRVRVVDAGTRLPIAGATAALGGVEGAASARAPGAPRAGTRRRTTDQEGLARFDGIEAGPVSIGAELEGCLDAAPRLLEIAAGGARAVTITLSRTAGLAGVVIDAAGAPIKGAGIVLLAEPLRPGRQRIAVAMPLPGVDPVTTAADGRFAFDRLPPGRALTLRAIDPRLAPREVAVPPLQPGERRTGLEVRLFRGAAITGRVIGPEGAPVAGAEVLAERQMEEESSGGFGVYASVGRAGGRSRDRRAPPRERQLPAARADASGWFRVAGAADGVWSLDVGAPGFAPRRVGGLRVAGGRDAEAGEVTLQPGARVRGRVAGPAAEPVALARVSIASPDEWFSMEVSTGADGRFESDDLEPGTRLTVAVRADGYAWWQQDGVVPSSEEMAIVLGPTSSLGGRVIAAAGRQPLGDFTLSIARVLEASGAGSSWSWMESEAERTFHAEDGAFLVEGLSPGLTAVRAAAPGYRPIDRRDIVIREGERFDGLVLALARAVTVSGTVTDEAGAPVADVLVTRRSSDEPSGMRAAWEDGVALSDGDGAFTITGLEPRSVTLDFEHADFEPASEEVDASGDRQGVRVRLARAAALGGTVVRAPGGAPVAGARVVARAAGDGGGPLATATSGTDGRFVLERLAAGRYAIEAQASGLRTSRVDGVLVARGVPPAPVEIRLEGGVTLRGTLLGVPETERGRLVVTSFDADGGTRGPAAVDVTGAFELGGLASGPSTLSFHRPAAMGYRVSRRVEIPVGVETHEVTLTIEEGHVIHGTIRRAGAPIGGARVDFWSRARRIAMSATTDAAGAYRAEGLAAGETKVAVTQYALGIAHRRDIVVDGDATLDIDLPVAVVEGVVREAGSDRPLEGATVTAAPAAGSGPGSGGGGASDRTDAAGAWRIDGLDPGAHTLTALHAGHAFATRVVEVPAAESDGDGGGAPVVFELDPASPLVLRIVDGASGQPVRKATCLVLAGGGDPLDPAAAPPIVAYEGTLVASAEGEFRVETLAPGTYRVVISAGELATETIHDLAVPGPTLDVTMAPAGSIRVRASGIPAGATARAVALDAAGRPMHLVAWTPSPYVTLRADGPSTLPNLRPGAYRLRAALPSGTVEVPVEVKAGAITDVSLP